MKVVESNSGLGGLDDLSIVRLFQSEDCAQECDAVEAESESEDEVKSSGFVDVVGQKDPERVWEEEEQVDERDPRSSGTQLARVGDESVNADLENREEKKRNKDSQMGQNKNIC